MSKSKLVFKYGVASKEAATSLVSCGLCLSKKISFDTMLVMLYLYLCFSKLDEYVLPCYLRSRFLSFLDCCVMC